MAERFSFGKIEGDPSDLFKECRNFKSVAPVGKKYITEEQKLIEVLGDQSAPSSISESEASLRESMISMEIVTPIVTSRNCGAQSQKDQYFRSVIQRRSAYFEDEKALTGTYFNVFQDVPPVFEACKTETIEHHVKPEEIIKTDTWDTFTEDTMFACEEQVLKKKRMSVKPEYDFLALDTREIKRSERSLRSRVMPLRPWLGERAHYTTDENGLQTLQNVSCSKIRDKKLMRYILKNQKK